MCGRFAYFDTDEFGERFHLDLYDEISIGSSYNVAPGQQIPVIVSTEGGTRALHVMRWGFLPPWATDERIGYKLINTRSETIMEKPMWKQAALHRRCLVPATGFFEWRSTGKGSPKIPYFIHPTDQALTSFAGVWGPWRSPTGEALNTVAIVTTSANAVVAPIHDRMPVILTPTTEAQWLSPTTTPALLDDLMQPYPAELLELFQVGTGVNSARFNDVSCVERISA